jgi:hypothetical protein
MDLKQASFFYSIELVALEELHREGYLDKELSESQMRGMDMLQAVWCRQKYLKIQLERFKPSVRKSLVQEKALSKIEKYILGRFMKLKRGDKLKASDLANELNRRFRAPVTIGLLSKIATMRKLARSKKQRIRYMSAKDDP